MKEMKETILDDLNIGDYITVRKGPMVDLPPAPFSMPRQDETGEERKIEDTWMQGAVLKVTGKQLPFIMTVVVWHGKVGYIENNHCIVIVDVRKFTIMKLEKEYAETTRKDLRTIESSV